MRLPLAEMPQELVGQWQGGACYTYRSTLTIEAWGDSGQYMKLVLPAGHEFPTSDFPFTPVKVRTVEKGVLHTTQTSSSFTGEVTKHDTLRIYE
jgi:hypothetical protein